MNRFGIYLVSETSIMAALLPFVLLVEYQRDLALTPTKIPAPEKVKLHLVISWLLGRKLWKAAVESKIFISLVCSNIQMFIPFLICGSSSSS